MVLAAWVDKIELQIQNQDIRTGEKFLRRTQNRIIQWHSDVPECSLEFKATIRNSRESGLFIAKTRVILI